MKASTILPATVLGAFLCMSLAAQGAPRAAAASGGNYLIAAEDLSNWHIGGFYRNQDRDLEGRQSLEQEKFMMHVGYDLLRWFSIYGVVGTTRIQLSPFSGESDADLEIGGGAWANLLDHDLLGGLTAETRLRIQATGQFTHTSPEINGSDVAINELYGAVTLGLVNEIIGNKRYWPEAIGLFAGPVYDRVESSDLDDSESDVGITAGLDFYLTRYVTMSVSYEAFESDGAINASVDLRF